MRRDRRRGLRERRHVRQRANRESGDVLFKLRMFDGLDQPAFQRLLAAIDKLPTPGQDRITYRNPWLAYFRHLSGDDVRQLSISGSTAQEVMEAADELADHVRSVFYGNKSGKKP